MSRIQAIPVVPFALGSRVAIICVGALAAAGFPTYDTSGHDVFRPSRKVADARPVDNLVLIAVNHLAHWDGQYFSHLAAGAYDELQFYAFFPGLPTAIRCTRALLAPLVAIQLLGDRPAYLLAGVLVSLATFVAAAWMLQRLTLQVTGNMRLANLSALLFCVGPLGVFSVAVYSESLFSALSFTGMSACESALARARTGEVRKAYLCLALATCAFTSAAATRSNGLLLGGYIIYYAMQVWGLVHAGWWEVPQADGSAVTADQAQASQSSFSKAALASFAARAFSWVVQLRVTAVSTFIVLLPSILFQYHAYFSFCGHPVDSGSHRWIHRILTAVTTATGSRLPPYEGPDEAWLAHTEAQPWCDTYHHALTGKSSGSWGDWVHAVTALPQPYAFVQAKHWGVRPFAYYQLKHAPQFLLAAPMLALAVSCVWAFFTRYRAHQALSDVVHPLRSLLAPCLRPRSSQKPASTRPNDATGADDGSALAALRALRSPPVAMSLLPHVLHLSALSVVALVAMNVQVATRVLGSACPVLYWHAAQLWLQAEEREEAAAGKKDDDRGSSRTQPRAAGTAKQNLRADFRPAYLTWGVSYSLVGAALFSLFLPWT